MTSLGLALSDEFLRSSVRDYYKSKFGISTFHESVEIHKSVRWKPTLYFTKGPWQIAVEASEKVLPAILGLVSSDVRAYPAPICVYVVCPAEVLATKQGQADVTQLRRLGYGLLTVDDDGDCERHLSANPLVQHILESEITALIEELRSKRIRSEVMEAYENYCHNAPSGVKSISEICEGLVMKAAQEAWKKGWVSKPSALAPTLQTMSSSAQFQNAKAQIGGMQAYTSEYRNLAHHFPQNAKKAHKKYGDCKHAFESGVRLIVGFRKAMISLQLSGNLPRNS